MITGLKRKRFLTIGWGILILWIMILAMGKVVRPLFADDDEPFVPGQVIVKLNTALGVAIEDINNDYGTTTLDSLLNSAAIYLLQVAPGQSVEVVVAAMDNDPRLLYAEPNFIGQMPEGNPSETWAWGGYDPNPYWGQYAGEMLHLTEAHQVTLGAGVRVAVLDTGVQLDHPQLAGSFVELGYDFIDDDPVAEDVFNGLDDDGDGLVDEGAGHGTHVAGLIHLVAPEAEILPLRVLDSDGQGNEFVIAVAVQYAAANGADVINLSLGTSAQSELMEDVIDGVVDAGIIVVAAAGNLNINSEQYPAAYEDVLAVTSVGPDATKSTFANYGTWVDIAAPGESITSTFPVDGYAQWSGTSMATPFVAGQAALLRTLFPTIPVADIHWLIQSTAQPLDQLNPGYSQMLGAGLPHIANSLNYFPLLYFSSATNGVINGLTFHDEDIVAFGAGGNILTIQFDGSDVGLDQADVDAFEFLADETILLSLESAFDLPGVGIVDDSDILRFIPTSTGDETAGTFELYFDGSDVGLNSNAEDIDAIGLTPNGRLLISTLGNFNVSMGVRDEDLLVFNALSLGWQTTGSWGFYFDGSDVELTESSENLWGVSIDSSTGELYLSSLGFFAVAGLNGDGGDVFLCHPSQLGFQTACTFDSELYWDGSLNGFGGVLDGVSIAQQP